MGRRRVAIGQYFPHLQREPVWNETWDCVKLVWVLWVAELNLQEYTALFRFEVPLLANLPENHRYITS